MSITIVEEGNSYLVVGNTISIKEFLKAGGATWNPGKICWAFDKALHTRQQVEELVTKVDSLITVGENVSHWIINGKTTPYKDILKAAGATWLGNFWGFDKLVYTREKVEKVVEQIKGTMDITNASRAAIGNAVANVGQTRMTPKTQEELSKLSLQELVEELQRVQKYSGAVVEALQKRVG